MLTYGYLLLFAWVLVEQFGIPLPATPVLLAAGALSAEHELSFPLALLAGMAASLMADSTWFLIGRRYGHHVLRILCKLSLEPTICVRRTQDSFGRRREVTLMIAKFVPGLATLAPPVAGQNGMGLGRFCSLTASAPRPGWALCWPWAGSSATRSSAIPACSTGRAASPARCWCSGILGFFVARIIRRRMVLKKLVAARLEPEELKSQLDAGEPVYIVDLRHPLELLPDPFTLPGALHFSPEALAARHLRDSPRPRHCPLLHLPQRGHRRQNRHDPSQAGHRARPPPARRLRRVEAPGLSAGCGSVGSPRAYPRSNSLGSTWPNATRSWPRHPGEDAPMLGPWF